MTVRVLRKNQRGPWCSYCDGKERAVHRGCGFRKFACPDHKSDLQAEDDHEQAMSDRFDQSDAAFTMGFRP